MNKITYSFLAICFLSVSIVTGQTKVVQNGAGYSLLRNGKPYYVKGVGGEIKLDYVVEIGGNSIRTWGAENAQQVLDEAQKRGLSVMLGLWLQTERQGFDYNDKVKVKKQYNDFIPIIEKYKNHPALLMWGIGNELNLQYTNTNAWNAVQEIAEYIHKSDPDHPTSTVTAGIDSMSVQLIRKMVPDIDIYCINTYGDIKNVPQNIEKYGWSGPYMITEWGPDGYWEAPKTTWDVALEQSSSQKKQVYFNRYRNYIEPYGNCLGSYAFYWGTKQEYTETWFGLFSKDQNPTEPIDALEMAFTGHNPSKPAPTILSMTIQDKTAQSSIRLEADKNYPAAVVAKIGLNMTDTAADTGNEFRYSWKILSESKDKKSGGDAEKEAQEMTGLIKHSDQGRINFRTPSTEGAYRLFVYVSYNNKIAYANIPFWVKKQE